VQAAITELGFVRNESASQLRAGRSQTIGLVVLDVANPFFTDVARGADDDPHHHRQVIFEPELVVRQSTERTRPTRPAAAGRPA